MPEIAIREVTRENWQAALRLAVHPAQQRFIADHTPIAAIALAKAYIRPGRLRWIPYAFYANATMVGFAELAYEPGSDENYWLFHFFIDSHYQGQGYGKQALQTLLQFIKEHFVECRAIQITVHPEAGLGFVQKSIRGVSCGFSRSLGGTHFALAGATRPG